MAKTFGCGSIAQPPSRAAASGVTKASSPQPVSGSETPAATARGTASPAQPGRPEDRPYKLTISLFVGNLLNHTNKGTPIGNLSSALFGTSNSLSGNSSFTFGASAAQSNRSVSLRAQFTF